MTRLVFFLEESSSKAMLKIFLPRFLPPEIQYRYHPFEGKSDLEKQLPRRLKGYQSDGENCIFVILRDQDSAHCKDVKDKLKRLAANAGHGDAFICIACQELESWYLADLEAVGMAYGLPKLKDEQRKAQYRVPDSIPKPSLKLEKLTKGSYQKQEGSRLIAKHLNPDNQRSNSFTYFVRGILDRIQ